MNLIVKKPIPILVDGDHLTVPITPGNDHILLLVLAKPEHRAFVEKLKS